MEIIEETYSGFCKALNETRTVFCEFEEVNGSACLESADCAFGRCEHTKTCLLMKPVREKTEKD